MPKGQGGPSYYAVEINPLDSIEEIKTLSEIKPIREKIITFATSLLSLANVKLDANLLIGHVLQSYTKEIFVESVRHASDQMAIYEKSHLIAKLSSSSSSSLVELSTALILIISTPTHPG